MAVAILFAGGSGTRMGAPIPKQFLPIGGKEVWAYTVNTFQLCSSIDSIVLVCHSDFVKRMRSGVVDHKFTKVSTVIAGGAERYHSAFYGLKARSTKRDDKVLICDIVRPCIQQAVIARVVKSLDFFKACDTGIPVTETIFEIEDSRIVTIPDRSRYALGQGPEGFHFSIVFEALEKYIQSGDKSCTNISGIVQKYHPHIDVAFVEGTIDNIKITSPQGLLLVARLLTAQQSQEVH